MSELQGHGSSKQGTLQRIAGYFEQGIQNFNLNHNVIGTVDQPIDNPH